MEGAGRALELFWDRKEKEDEVKRKPCVVGEVMKERRRRERERLII